MKSLKAGDRVRVLITEHAAGIKPGDKGTLLRADETFYIVAMDTTGPASITVVFAEGEIEADDES